MPTSGRKPHTSYGDLGLMTMTINGPLNAENRGITNENEKKCSLKQNRTDILGRGSEEYILSLREGTLEASTVNWIIPEPWVREWSFKNGGFFSSTQSTGTSCKLALISENMQIQSDGTLELINWADWSDNGFDFGTVSGQEPTVAYDSTKDYFAYITPSGSTSNPNVPVTTHSSVGSALDVDISQQNFAVVVLCKPDGSGNKTLFNIGQQTATGHFRLQLQGASNARVSVFTSGGETRTVDTVYTANEYSIIIGGSKDSSGTAFVRVNGEEKTISGTVNACTDISCTSAATNSQVLIGCGETSTAYNRIATNVEIYEVHYIVSDTVNNEFLSDLKKLEGSLARKYNMLDSLPAAHTYKTDPPYGSPIKQGANRYG